MTTAPVNSRLSTADCWKLLEQERVGRLAVTARDGSADIFPVNFVAFEGAVYIRTAPDVKVVALAAHSYAAFEIDGHDDSGWWSVVVRGDAAQLRDDVEIERSGIMRLTTASPRHKQHVLKLTASTVTGRRFVDHDVRTRPSTVRSRTALAAAAEGEAKRGSRPETIPSRRPQDGGATSHGRPG